MVEFRVLLKHLLRSSTECVVRLADEVDVAEVNHLLDGQVFAFTQYLQSWG